MQPYNKISLDKQKYYRRGRNPKNCREKFRTPSYLSQGYMSVWEYNSIGIGLSDLIASR